MEFILRHPHAILDTGDSDMTRKPRKKAKTTPRAPFSASKIVMRDPSELVPFPNNPKLHPPEQIDALARVIAEFGFDQPILVDEHDTVLKGHGRRLASLKIELPLVPTIVHEGLSIEDKIAIVLSDNQLPTLSGFDQSLLRVNLSQLAKVDYPLELTGYDNVRLATFIGAPPSDSEGDPDAQPPVEDTPVSRIGDVWKLGDHTLHCGDSESFSLNEPIRLQLSDPPYDLEGVGGGIQGKRTYPDKIIAAGIDKFSVLQIKNFGRTNVFFTSKKLIPNYIQLALDKKLAWDLNFLHRANAMPNTAMHLMTDIDYIVVMGAMDPARGLELQNYSKMLSLGHWDRPVPWAKPVDVLTKYLRLFSTVGDAILDPYCGSGSTIIAAEVERRRCIGIEINPVFADIAIRRWQMFAGKKATLAGGKKTFEQIERERSKLAA